MDSQPRLLSILNGVSLLLVAMALVMVFAYAPLERTMGQVQRVFYFHVATAWVGMLGFIVAAFAGVAYLVKKDFKWDIVAVAAVEVSLVFFFVAIVTGSVWARPAWNTWWKWDDPRLMSAAVVELVFAALLMLRQGIDDPERRARFGAVYTLLSALSVPLTFVSIRLLKTIHPVVIGGGETGAGTGDFGMTSKMLQTMFFSMAVFSFVFVTLLWHRIRMGRLAEKVEQLRLKYSL